MRCLMRSAVLALLLTAGAPGAAPSPASFRLPADPFGTYRLELLEALSTGRLLVITHRESTTSPAGHTARLIDCAAARGLILAGGTQGFEAVAQRARIVAAQQPDLLPLVQHGADVLTTQIAEMACARAASLAGPAPASEKPD
ncbi:MAG: hypothetical protein ACFBRM_10385 [Pikeienuella sp.]